MHTPRSCLRSLLLALTALLCVCAGPVRDVGAQVGGPITFRVVDASGTDIPNAEVQCDGAFDWTPAPYTHAAAIEQVYTMRAQSGAFLLASISGVLQEGTTYWVDPVKGDYRTPSPGTTAVNYVFREVVFDTVDEAGNHVEGEVQYDYGFDWTPTAFRWLATYPPGPTMRGRHGGREIAALSQVIRENTTYWVDPLKGDYRTTSPGTTAVNYVFREVVFDTVDGAGNHVEGEVQYDYGFDWTPTAFRWLATYPPGPTMRGRHGGREIAALSQVIRENTTYWVDPVKGDYRTPSPGTTAVNYVFREVVFDTVDGAGNHVEGEVQYDYGFDWTPTAFRWLATYPPGPTMRGRHGGREIAALSQVIRENTTYWVDPLKGDYRTPSPGTTAVNYVFREVVFDTVDGAGNHVEGEVQYDYGFDWTPTAFRWLATYPPGPTMRGRRGGREIAALSQVIRENTTYWVDPVKGDYRTPTPGVTGVNYVFAEPQPPGESCTAVLDTVDERGRHVVGSAYVFGATDWAGTPVTVTTNVAQPATVVGAYRGQVLSARVDLSAQNTTYWVDPVGGDRTSVTPGKTQVNFVYHTYPVILDTVDESGNHLVGSALVYGFTDWAQTPVTVMPAAADPVTVMGFYRGQVLSGRVDLNAKDTTYWIDPVGGNRTTVTPGKTQVNFVYHTYPVVLDTVDESGNHLVGSALVYGFTDWAQTPVTVMSPTADPVTVMGSYRGQVLSGRVDLNAKDTTYWIDPVGGNRSTVTPGKTQVNFVYHTYPVVLDTVDESGNHLVGSALVYGFTDWAQTPVTVMPATADPVTVMGSYRGQVLTARVDLSAKDITYWIDPAGGNRTTVTPGKTQVNFVYQPVEPPVGPAAVEFDTVDASGQHVPGDVQCDYAFDWTPTPLRWGSAIPGGYGLRGRHRGWVIGTDTSVIHEGETCYVDPLKGNHWEAGDGKTRVLFVFRKVVFDTVDGAGNHIQGDVQCDYGFDWTPTAFTWQGTIGPGYGLRGRYQGWVIGSSTAVIQEGTTYYVDPLKGDRRVDSPDGKTRVVFVFRAVEIDTQDGAGNHLAGDAQCDYGFDWTPTAFTWQGTIGPGYGLRGRYQGWVIGSSTAVIQEGTTYYVDPLKGDRRVDSPDGKTRVIFVFRAIRFDTVDASGKHVAGEAQCDYAFGWTPTAFTWQATLGPGYGLRGRYQGAAVTTSTAIIEEGKTVYVDANRVIARTPTPGTTAVCFVFGAMAHDILFEKDVSSFTLQPGQVHTLTVNVVNTDTESAHDLSGLAVLDSATGVSARFEEPGVQQPVRMAAGETRAVTLTVDATQAAPGTRCELTGKCLTDGDPKRAHYTKLVIAVETAEPLADFEVTSEDITFDPLPGVPGQESTVRATIRNLGTTAPESVVVAVKDFDTEIDRQTVPAPQPGTEVVLTATHTWDTASIRLITVVVDPDDEVPELDETSNSASKAYQVGPAPPMAVRLVVAGSLPAELNEGTTAVLSGEAFYEILLGPGNVARYPAKGAAVTLRITYLLGGEVFRAEGVFTDQQGRFSVPFPVPGSAGDEFNVAVTVTDGTLTGTLNTSFRVVTFVPPPPPPPPGPGPAPTPVNDLWVRAEDIAFSNWNPALGETITVGAAVHASPENDRTFTDVPVSFTARHPIAGEYAIGLPLHIGALAPGASQGVSTTWTNAAEGIYLIQAALAPGFSDDNDADDAATRAIIVGELNNLLVVTIEAPTEGAQVSAREGTEIRVRVTDRQGNLALPEQLDSLTLQFSGAYVGSEDLKACFEPVSQCYIFRWQPPTDTDGKTGIDVLAQAVVGQQVVNGGASTWVEVVDDAGPAFFIRAYPAQAEIGTVVTITVDASEALAETGQGLIAVTDSAGHPIALAAGVYHPWSTHWVFQTERLPAGTALGTATIEASGVDQRGNEGTGQGAFEVIGPSDATPPEVALSTGLTSLWPPDHSMVDVALSLSVHDDKDPSPTVSFSVTQDESVDDTGDGKFAPDAEIVKAQDGSVSGLRLRAERRGNGNGRVYLVTVTATDASGKTTTRCCAVTVPKSNSRKDRDAVAAEAAEAVRAGAPLPYDSTR